MNIISLCVCAHVYVMEHTCVSLEATGKHQASSSVGVHLIFSIYMYVCAGAYTEVYTSMWQLKVSAGESSSPTLLPYSFTFNQTQSSATLVVFLESLLCGFHLCLSRLES